MEIGYEDRYRIIAIDPSTSQIGIAVIEVDLSNGAINIPFSYTFRRRDLIRGHKWMADVYGEREAAVYCYGNVLRNLLVVWEPSAVAIEAPYLDKFPQAFKALTEICTTFRNAVIDWDPTVPVEFTDPATVKKSIGVSGKSDDKGLMREGIIKSELPIHYSNNISISTMTEHEVDAVAVGIHFINKNLSCIY